MRGDRGGLAFVVAVALSSIAGNARQAPAQPPAPTIVVIVTDDQRWDSLWAMPTVDRELAGRGVTFTNGFVVNPLCCPSRASIFTGQYSHSTDVYKNSPPHGGWESFDESSTVATWLDDAGYRTALVGKYMNSYDGTSIPRGWDRWMAFVEGSTSYYDYTLNVDGTLETFGSSPKDYSTDVLAEAAAAFVRDAQAEVPLFLYFAPFAPHSPATPAQRHEGAFGTLEPWRPRSYDEADVSDKPLHIRETPRLSGSKRVAIDELRIGQYETLLAVDEAVAGILAALRETGRLASSLLVFTSDNGYLWGEHRWRGKHVPYDESIRVPMVVRYDPLVVRPGFDDHLVLNIDIAPTAAAVGGVESPGADGESLLSLLDGSSTSWRREFIVEHLESRQQPVPTYCAVRATDFAYVFYATWEEELYDLTRDPYELRNATDRKRRVTRLMRDRARTLCDPPPPGLVFPA